MYLKAYIKVNLLLDIIQFAVNLKIITKQAVWLDTVPIYFAILPFMFGPQAVEHILETRDKGLSPE